jgi:hypothetical protein
MSGRTVQLKELHQESVYEGVLQGVPTQADNARFVADLLATGHSPHESWLTRRCS